VAEIQKTSAAAGGISAFASLPKDAPIRIGAARIVPSAREFSYTRQRCISSQETQPTKIILFVVQKRLAPIATWMRC
jgi:hypothetical protein